MRKRAEEQIRKAAGQLEDGRPFRVDRVWRRVDMVRKVFDKTLLDMQRVGTIELYPATALDMDTAGTADLLRKGEAIYGSFSFVEADPVTTEAESVDVVIEGVDPVLWRHFRYLCKAREDKDPVQKIVEMIEKYNRRGI